MTNDRGTAVERTWPYDGPYDSDSAATAATAIRQLVRYLNNATTKHGTLPYPSTVGEVLAGLTDAAHGLDQLIRQLERATRGFADAGTLYDDRHDRPGARTAAELIDRLENARQAAARLAQVLQAAGGPVNHLGTE